MFHPLFTKSNKSSSSTDNPTKTPSVIVGPYGHCLTPGKEGRVVSTRYGYAVK